MLWPRRNLGRGCCSPSRPPAPPQPRAANTHPQAMTGLDPGQGRPGRDRVGWGGAGLLPGGLLSRPPFPQKVMSLPPGEICRGRESWVERVSRGAEVPLAGRALWVQAGLGAAGRGDGGPPGMGFWVGPMGGGPVRPLCPGAPKVLSLNDSPRGRGRASTQQGFYLKQPS